MNHRGDRRGAIRLLAGMLIGFCGASAGFLAVWPANSPSSETPPLVYENMIDEDKLVYTGATLVPVSTDRSVKKVYTDRIEPAQTVTSLERRKQETQTRGIRLKNKPAKIAACQRGQIRNAKGICGWLAPSRSMGTDRSKFSR